MNNFSMLDFGQKENNNIVPHNKQFLLNALRNFYITILCVWAMKPDHHDMHNRFQQCPSPPTPRCTTIQIDVILRKYTHTMHMNLFMTNLSSRISTFVHMKHQPQQHVSMWWCVGYLSVHDGYVKHTETDLIDETYTKYKIMEIAYKSIWNFVNVYLCDTTTCTQTIVSIHE